MASHGCSGGWRRRDHSAQSEYARRPPIAHAPSALPAEERRNDRIPGQLHFGEGRVGLDEEGLLRLVVGVIESLEG